MSDGHQRIIEGAARLIRERGIRGTSVADAMKQAELTHGGFYRHFSSKDELTIAALRMAFDELIAPLEVEKNDASAKDALAGFTDLYLSDEHVLNPGIGCPMPVLAGEVGREGEAVKAEFGAGVRRTVEAMESGLTQSTAEQRRAAALQNLCMLVGAVTLARASDTATAHAILEAARATFRN